MVRGLLHHKGKNGGVPAPDAVPGTVVLRRVVPISEAFDRIKQVHAGSLHAGYVKTYDAVSNWYYSMAKNQVQWLVERYQTCLKNRPNRSRGELEPIISNCIFERIQIDLVDIRHEPNGQYKWIPHVKDHFSKFCSLIPLRSKRAEEVADANAVWIGYFEPLKILQCNNGNEFKVVLLILLRKHGIK